MSNMELVNYCKEWLGITGLDVFEGWSLADAQFELDTVREDFPELTAQELYETMRNVLADARKQDVE